jgi:hypothetical protein
MEVAQKIVYEQNSQGMEQALIQEQALPHIIAENGAHFHHENHDGCGPECAVHSRPEALAEANAALDDILNSPIVESNEAENGREGHEHHENHDGCGPECAVHSRPEALAEANDALDDILNSKTASAEDAINNSVAEIFTPPKKTAPTEQADNAAVIEAQSKQTQNARLMEELVRAEESSEIGSKKIDIPVMQNSNVNQAELSESITDEVVGQMSSSTGYAHATIPKSTAKTLEKSSPVTSETVIEGQVSETANIQTRQEEPTEVSVMSIETVIERPDENIVDSASFNAHTPKRAEGEITEDGEEVGYEWINPTIEGAEEAVDDYLVLQEEKMGTDLTQTKNLHPSISEITHGLQQENGIAELMDTISEYVAEAENSTTTENAHDDSVEGTETIRQLLESIVLSEPETSQERLSILDSHAHEVIIDESVLIEKICDLAVRVGISEREVDIINSKIKKMTEKEKRSLLVNIQYELIKIKDTARDRKVSSFVQFTNVKQDRDSKLRQLASTILSSLLDFDAKSSAKAA